MNQIKVGIIGTGWCGGIRAVASANSAMVSELHIAEIRPERLEEVAAMTHPVTATTDWEMLVSNPDIDAIMVSATLGLASAIITESSLSFLGLGFPPDFPTWGRLLYDGKDFIQLTPDRVIWPGLAISLTVLSVNYMGDGLRDALDPRLRG